MKKFLVVLMILVVAGGVFAQDVAVSGAVKFGTAFLKEQGSDDIIVFPYSDDVDSGLDLVPPDLPIPLRAELTFHATWDNVGAKIRLRDDFTGHNTNSALDGYAYVYANALNDMIKISGGKLSDTPWSTGGDEDWSLGNTFGARIEVKPIDGLNLGVALDVPVVAAHGTLKIADFLQETVIGAKYTADAFAVDLGVKLDSEADPIPGNSSKEIELQFGFVLTSIANLTAFIEGDITELNDDDNREIDIREKVGYQISDALEAHLAFSEYGSLKDLDADPLGIDIWPGLSYFVIPDKFNAYLDVGIIANTKFDPLNFEIIPGIEWYYANNAKINFFYDGLFGKDAADIDITTHIVQVDFVWTF
jgi:hypothetical protein